MVRTSLDFPFITFCNKVPQMAGTDSGSPVIGSNLPISPGLLLSQSRLRSSEGLRLIHVYVPKIFLP